MIHTSLNLLHHLPKRPVGCRQYESQMEKVIRSCNTPCNHQELFLGLLHKGVNSVFSSAPNLVEALVCPYYLLMWSSLRATDARLKPEQQDRRQWKAHMWCTQPVCISISCDLDALRVCPVSSVLSNYLQVTREKHLKPWTVLTCSIAMQTLYICIHKREDTVQHATCSATHHKTTQSPRSLRTERWCVWLWY